MVEVVCWCFLKQKFIVVLQRCQHISHIREYCTYDIHSEQHSIDSNVVDVEVDVFEFDTFIPDDDVIKGIGVDLLLSLLLSDNKVDVHVDDFDVDNVFTLSSMSSTDDVGDGDTKSG